MVEHRFEFLKNSRGGFSLIETMIAISVLAVGILAVASMQVTSIKENAYAFHLTEATTWGVDQLEFLMSLPYNDPLLEDVNGDGPSGMWNPLPLPPAQPIPDPATLPPDYPPIRQGIYTIFWNVDVNPVINGIPMNHSKSVNVVVTWPEQTTKKGIVLQHFRPGLMR